MVINCRLRKIKDSKLEVEMLFDNQTRDQLRMNVLYKIPKSLKVEKVTKIHRKFILRNMETHIFNLKVS